MGKLEAEGGQDRNPSVQYEMKRARRAGMRDMIIALIIIVGALLFQQGRDNRVISLRLSPEETQVTVVGADGSEHPLRFSELGSVELFTDLAAFDRGEQSSGETTKKFTSGRFRSDAYGEYELHVMNKLSKYIVARGPEGTLVFNFESDESTEAIYSYICEHRADN